jgi:hypothetical protein
MSQQDSPSSELQERIGDSKGEEFNAGTTTASSTLAPTLDYTEAEEKRLVRKLDWKLLPILTVLYLLSFLDRSNLGNAKIEGLITDVGVKDYSNLLTVFYVAYVVAEV